MHPFKRVMHWQPQPVPPLFRVRSEHPNPPKITAAGSFRASRCLQVSPCPRQINRAPLPFAGVPPPKQNCSCYRPPPPQCQASPPRGGGGVTKWLRHAHLISQNIAHPCPMSPGRNTYFAKQQSGSVGTGTIRYSLSIPEFCPTSARTSPWGNSAFSNCWRCQWCHGCLLVIDASGGPPLLSHSHTLSHSLTHTLKHSLLCRIPHPEKGLVRH